MTPAWLWAIFTVFAAAGQTGRNTIQRQLTPSLGAVGATHVRFLFGLPFAVLFLIGVVAFTHEKLPSPSTTFWLWMMTGAITQIVATALMLLLMKERSFVVATAYIKTEPVFVAFFGLIFLGDVLNAATVAAIAISMIGVAVMSFDRRGGLGGGRVALLGFASGGFFAFSAIGFRGAVLSLHGAGYLMAATFVLTIGLATQVALLTTYLAVRSPQVLRNMLGLWRPALSAGLMAAVASEMWCLALALSTAASVRTLGLVDVIFAQAVSRFVFHHRTTTREFAGIGLILAGAILLVVVDH